MSGSAVRSNPLGPTRAGFTLLELLGVLAIVAILAGIMLPVTSQVRTAARRARTQVRFAQWATAIEFFRDEYGAYPVFAAEAKVNAGAAVGLAGVHPFHDLLAGRRRDGSALPEPGAVAAGAVPPPERQNLRRIAFARFTVADLAAPDGAGPERAGLLQDDFGGTDIAVLVDRNQDGWINAADYPEWPTVQPPDAPGRRLSPAEPIATGIRAGVLLYSAPPGATAPQQLIRQGP